jgi:hypothetical protein
MILASVMVVALLRAADVAQEPLREVKVDAAVVSQEYCADDAASTGLWVGAVAAQVKH